MDAYNPPWATPATTTNYREAISYDPNGNIRTYLRNGAGSTNAMDNLTYQYNLSGGRPINNKLRFVTDVVPANNFAEDIENPEPDVVGDNYKYDAIGNLINEGHTSISWNVYGKISKISNTKEAYTLDYTKACPAFLRGCRRQPNREKIHQKWGGLLHLVHPRCAG